MNTGKAEKVTLQEILLKVDKLPQLPEAALRLTKLMEDPDTSAEDMANVIRLDPDMTTQVLRLCNSATYGLNRTISTVKEAVAILGLKTLKSLVYVIISKYALDRPIEGYGLDRGVLWHNSLTCAVYSKYLAEKIGGVDPELVFTGALLRDIGKIVLGEYVGSSYKEIEQMAIEKQMDFIQAEEEVIGIDHCVVGRHIAEKWNLPASIIQVIQYKNRPSALASGDPKVYRLVTVIHLADTFTKIIGSGIGSDGLMYSLDQKALADTGISVDPSFMDSTLARLLELDSVVDEMVNSLKGGA